MTTEETGLNPIRILIDGGMQPAKMVELLLKSDLEAGQVVAHLIEAFEGPAEVVAFLTKAGTDPAAFITALNEAKPKPRVKPNKPFARMNRPEFKVAVREVARCSTSADEVRDGLRDLQYPRANEADIKFEETPTDQVGWEAVLLVLGLSVLSGPDAGLTAKNGLSVELYLSGPEQDIEF